MIHIVFQQADVAVLKKAIELDAGLEGEIIEIKDDYAVGPLVALFETEGYQARRAWWKTLLQASPYSTDDLMNAVDDRLAMHQLKKALDENGHETVWIWAGQNGHDVCGYFWLVAQLKAFAGRIFILYLNNLPFINEKGAIYYPTTLHDIQPKEFLKAKKLARAITRSEWETDGDEWNRLATENALIRILEGGKKISSQPDNFYDMDILKSLSGDWQKGSKAIHNILAKMKIKTGDVFLLARLKQLAEDGKVEITGEPAKGWKEFEVRLKTTQTEPATETI
ncbi:MAG TPA: DUF1835 domain-containing protein [Chitinophagaceae bacterium]|nr:DUF1835 domain-containing protein [Chitinophagaceae bacterium]